MTDPFSDLPPMDENEEAAANPLDENPLDEISLEPADLIADNPVPVLETKESVGDSTASAEIGELDEEDDGEVSSWDRMVHKLSGMGFSFLVHILIFFLFAAITFDTSVIKFVDLVSLPTPEEDDPPVEVELEPEIEVVPPENVSLFTASPASLSATAAAATTPVLDQTLVAKAQTSDLQIDAPTLSMPNSMALIEAVPDGDIKGDPRDLVADYQQAMDRIAQELLWMLDKSPVLTVWCFDQSQSMKDDQKEIRERIHTVYEQLGLDPRSKALLTAVTSFGQGFVDHSNHKPTANLDTIGKAIDAVPVDKTGFEMMCTAIGKTINLYRDQARRGRQMALILVSDESGNPRE